MKLIDLAIRRPVMAWMLMSALIIFGAISYLRLGVSQMPDVDFPVLDIGITFEGASPGIIEAELVDPIESRVIAVEGVKEVRSSIRQGSANVRLELTLDRNVDVALQEVQAALSQLRLPVGVDQPVIRKSNPEEEPIMFIGFGGTKPMRELIRYADQVLLDQIQVLPGVGEVGLAGFAQPNLRIWIDNNKLQRFQLTVLDVIKAVEEGHVERAAGYIENSKVEQNVRTMGEQLTAEKFGEIAIRTRGSEVIYGQVLKLKDVVRIEDGLSDRRRLSRFNGKDGLSISVRKQRGANEVAVAKVLREKIETLKSSLPEGYTIQINADFTRFTEQTVSSTTGKLIAAGIFTAIVCLLFLGSLTSAFNVLLSIPTSIVGTFIVIYFAGFTLNLFTLLGLALAISIVVDDAIMMLENIIRHSDMGKSRVKAARDGAKEIYGAASATTLAVIAIFLPVVFMDGTIGKFFFQFGVTVSTAVLLSLLEAVTLTPMRASKFLDKSNRKPRLARIAEAMAEKMAHAYARILEPSLRHKGLVLGVSFALFLGSLLLFGKVRKEFVPNQDQGFFILSAQTPTGWSLEATNSIVSEIEKFIGEQPEVERFFISVGAGGPSSQTNNSFMPITLKPREERSVTQNEFIQRVRDQFKSVKGLRVQARDLSARGLTSGRVFPMSFNVTGPDYDTLKESAKKIIKELEESKIAIDLDMDYKEGQPEIQITPLRERAAELGVSIDAIARTVNATVGGLRSGQFTSGGRRYDIRIRLEADQRQYLDDIKKVFVRNQFNNLIPLSQVVDVKLTSTVQSLNRLNRRRAISVFGNLPPEMSQSVALKEARIVATKHLPEGYSFNLEGAAQSFQESFGSLYFALGIGVLVAYMILAAQFNSYIHPISVLLALPFSLTGALLALWMFDVSLNLYSMIGIVLLMGIAKKNSIMLVEFTNQKREQGMSLFDAQMYACPARLRPILMTSVATIAAALPLVFDSAPGRETRIPMGLSIIGGTVVSTLFSLLVVPAFYAFVSRFERKDQHERELAEEYGTEPHHSDKPIPTKRNHTAPRNHFNFKESPSL